MEKKSRTKFNVSKDPADRTYDGVVYDSKAEMLFYRDIVLPRLASGEIVECRKQVPFLLQEAFRRVDKDGKNVAVRKIDYVVVASHGPKLCVLLPACCAPSGWPLLRSSSP